MLQHILYPRPPVDETHGLPTFGSGPVLHPPIHGHDSQAYPFDNTPLQGLPAVPPGWFLSPYTGWYFVPPYQVLSTSSATDPVSPLCTRTYRQHHPSSNSAFLGPPDSISPSQARSDSQVPPLHRTGSISPEPVYLKSALRSTSSDPVTTPRQVRFRETPDIAFLSQTSSVSSLSNGHGVLQADQTPRWTLHKHSASRQKPSKDIDGNTEPLTKPLDSRPSVCDAVDEYPSLSLGDGTRGLDAYLSHDLHDARSGEVPDSLRAAHRRLLDFETEDTHASGKRSGKHLVRELERMAETATNGHFRGPYHWKTSQEIESRNGEDDYAHGSIKMSSSAGTVGVIIGQVLMIIRVRAFRQLAKTPNPSDPVRTTQQMGIRNTLTLSRIAHTHLIHQTLTHTPSNLTANENHVSTTRIAAPKRKDFVPTTTIMLARHPLHHLIRATLPSSDAGMSITISTLSRCHTLHHPLRCPANRTALDKLIAHPHLTD